MAILAIITAVVSVIVGLATAVGQAFHLPDGVAGGFNLLIQYISTGISFLYNFLPDSFWSLAKAYLVIILTAHAAYFAYSTGISIWRIFQGGGD